MRKNLLWLAALMLAMLVSTGSWASGLCASDTPQVVTEADMLHPPVNMLAFRAQIKKILIHGRLNPKPHMGFAVDYQVEKIYQGNVPGKLISLEYGGCQMPPGHEGDTVYVLAMADHNVDWFAPEFWRQNK